MNESLANYSILKNTEVSIENGHDSRDESLAQAEIATLAVIFTVTVVGNVLVLLALWTRTRYAGRRKMSRMYFFILHLSLADLITAFFNVLPQLAWDITFRFLGGDILCKLVKFGQLLGPYLSSYILMATAIDRHQAICYPLTYCSWTSRRSKVMVWIAWSASLLFCLPQVTIFSYKYLDDLGVYDCWATFNHEWGQRAYVTWYSISVFIIPLAVLVFTYGCICRVIWRSPELGFRSVQSRRGSPSISPPGSERLTSANTSVKQTIRRQQPLISRAKINTVKQTIAVIATYIVCSSPFIVVQLWVTWDPEAHKNAFFEGPVFTIISLLSSLNSCVNPWIYLAFNRELPRLLVKHYAAARKNYRQAGNVRPAAWTDWPNELIFDTEGSASNSSGGCESTSLRALKKWPMCHARNGNGTGNGKSNGINGGPGPSTHLPVRVPIQRAAGSNFGGETYHLAYYGPQRFTHVTSTSTSST